MSGTFDLGLVLAIVAVAVVYLVRRNIRNRKNGTLGCGCGCDSGGCCGSTPASGKDSGQGCCGCGKDS